MCHSRTLIAGDRVGLRRAGSQAHDVEAGPLEGAQDKPPTVNASDTAVRRDNPRLIGIRMLFAVLNG